MSDKHDIYSSSHPEDQENLNDDMAGLPELRQKKIKEFRLELDPSVFEEDTAAPVETSGPEAVSPAQRVDLPGDDEISSFSQGTADEYGKYGRQAPVSQQKTKQKKVKRKKKNGCLYTMIYGVVICFSALILSQFIIHGAYDLLGVNKEEKDVTIEITPEMGNEEVITQLVDNGVVKEPFFFKLYTKMTKASFRPGKYTIQADMDYEAIINSLQSNANRVDTVSIMFPEGSTAEEIAQKLEDANVCSKEEFLKELNSDSFENYSFIKKIENESDRVYKLEGYLYPDTYEFYLYENPKTAIKRFLNNYNNRITKEMMDQAEELGMTMDQVLALASMIEKEAKTSDMAKVSSVFHNRLKKPDVFPCLQSNTTDYYPYTKDTVPEGYADTSKYNTYKIKGLPPGAICNPGMAAIQAALNPATTGYYFFNMDVNGKAYFAKTVKEHERNLQIAAQVKKQEPSSEAASVAASGTLND